MTSASYLPLRINKFRSLLFVVVVHAGSDKDLLMCGSLCGKVQLLFTLHQSSIDSQLFIENRGFSLPHLHLMAPLRGPCRNIAMMFGLQKKL